MDFGIYPPEINSGRLYAGPGPGPMLAAAAAWASLAAELAAAAQLYQSVVDELIAGPWQGPSSVAMAAAAAHFASWLSVTGGQAEQTADQAAAAAAAYDETLLAAVPPPVIAANRSLLMALVATNLFGQNTATIAATEAQYFQMWAQDAAAMYSYAHLSAEALALPPFTAPLTTISSLITIFVTGPINLAALLVITPMSITVPVDLPFCMANTAIGVSGDDIVNGWAGVSAWPDDTPIRPTEFARIISTPSEPSVTLASFSDAQTVGSLSVPRTWTVAAPEASSATAVRPTAPTNVSLAAADVPQSGPGRTFSQMMLAGMLGSGMTNVVGSGGGPPDPHGSDNKRVTTRAEDPESFDADPAFPGNPRAVMTGIAARIRELATLRDMGELTDQEFTEQKNRLLSG